MAELLPLPIHGPTGTPHYLGAECPCRPYPAQAEGFAGVVHREANGEPFLEAQVCQDHDLHLNPPGVVGVAAGPLCEQAGDVRRVLSEADAIAAATAAWRAGRRQNRTVKVGVLVARDARMTPSNLGGSDE